MKYHDIVLIDICGTIFNSNTTFDFLDTQLFGNKYNLFRKISKTLLGRIINKIFYSSIHIDLIRNIAFSFLRGTSKSILLNKAEHFYYNQLKRKAYDKIIKVIDILKKENKEIILASATVDFVAEIIAQQLNIKKVIATELEYKNGICMGRIKHDNWGNKLASLENKKINPPYYMTITDNYSDIDILKYSSFKIFIVTNDIQKKKWEKIISKFNWTNVFYINPTTGDFYL